MLTLIDLEFEHVEIIERTTSTPGSLSAPHTLDETKIRILEQIMICLLEYTKFGVFRPFIEKAQFLLSSGHLRNVREVEVMLLAHSYVSASIVDYQ